jgi:hypothetical protein
MGYDIFRHGLPCIWTSAVRGTITAARVYS